MAFAVVSCGTRKSNLIPKRHLSLDRYGFARLHTADLQSIGIDDRATVLIDVATKRIALRRPRDGEAEQTATVRPVHDNGLGGVAGGCDRDGPPPKYPRARGVEAAAVGERPSQVSRPRYNPAASGGHRVLAAGGEHSPRPTPRPTHRQTEVSNMPQERNPSAKMPRSIATAFGRLIEVLRTTFRMKQTKTAEHLTDLLVRIRARHLKLDWECGRAEQQGTPAHRMLLWSYVERMLIVACEVAEEERDGFRDALDSVLATLSISRRVREGEAELRFLESVDGIVWDGCSREIVNTLDWLDDGGFTRSLAASILERYPEEAAELGLRPADADVRPASAALGGDPSGADANRTTAGVRGLRRELAGDADVTMADGSPALAAPAKPSDGGEAPTTNERWLSAKEATKRANRATGVGKDWSSYWGRWCRTNKVRIRPARKRDGTPSKSRTEVELNSLAVATYDHEREFEKATPESVKRERALREKWKIELDLPAPDE